MSVPIPIIGSIVDGIINFFTMDKEKRLELKEIKQRAIINSEIRKDKIKEAKELAQIERINNQDQNTADYDRIAQENARTSWMDEIMISWVLVMVTLLFFEVTQPSVIKGFDALSEVPVWFQLVFVGCFIAKLGLRFLFTGRSLFGRAVK